MDRHHADGVVVGLRDDGFGYAGACLCLAAEPFHKLAKGGPAGIAERARLLKNEAQPLPRFAGPPVSERRFEQPPFAQHAIHQFADAVPPARSVQSGNRPERGRYGVDWGTRHLGNLAGVVPMALCLDEFVELIIRAAEGGRT